MFRSLKKDDVDCRVQVVKENGCSLLLYKNARCDMAILDETVKPLNWQRSHTRDNHNCIVSIWDKEKKQWISKEDTGVESRTEQAKGLASDSFKRACTNWGIGRELYTAPFIWIKLANGETYMSGKDKYNKPKYALDKKVKFSVSNIQIENGKIVDLEIKKNNYIAYRMNKKYKPKTQKRSNLPTVDDLEGLNNAGVLDRILDKRGWKTASDIPEIKRVEVYNYLLSHQPGE